MFRFISSLVFCLLFVFSAQAQSDYNNAIGLRLGAPMAISYKHKLNNTGAVELTLSTQGRQQVYSSYRWLGVSAGYQIHNDLNLNIKGLEQLQWYYGGGLSAFFWSWRYDSAFSQSAYSNTSLGIQGYLGLDYTFKNTPINLTLDWTPVFFLNGFGSGLGAGYAQLGVRYVLN